jgi:hypothetical protein
VVTHSARSFGPSHDVSFEFPKIAPSPYSSRGVHSRFHVAVVASETGNQPLSRSASVVSHHLGGLLFLDPLRIFVGVPVLGFMTFHAALRRIPRHEVLPFEALLLVCSGLNRCRSTSPVGPTSPAESPRQFTARLAPSSLVLSSDRFVSDSRRFPVWASHDLRERSASLTRNSPSPSAACASARLLFQNKTLRVRRWRRFFLDRCQPAHLPTYPARLPQV